MGFRQCVAMACRVFTTVALTFFLIRSGSRTNCGPPAYPCSRTDTAVTQPDVSPIPNFGGLKGANTVVTDSAYNNVEIVRCTDAASDPSRLNASYAVGLGGSGDKNSWNLDDSLISLGSGHIFRFDAINKSCRPVCANGSSDLHCTGSTLYVAAVNGYGVFSKVDPHIFYRFRLFSPLVKSLTIGSGAPSPATIVVDFSPALYKGSAPAWSASTAISLGTVIKPTKNNPGKNLFQAITGGKTGKSEFNWTRAAQAFLSVNHTPLPLPDWSPGSKILNAKIEPVNGNVGKHIYKVTVAGTPGHSAPTWCYTYNCTVIDGSVTWTNVGSSATIQDGTVTWVKVGPNEAETWTDLGGVENQDRDFALGLSYSGYQDTGVWIVLYDAQANKFYQLNTYTKIETDFVCARGKGYACSGGTWIPTVVGPISSPDYVTVHDVTLALSGHDVVFICGAYAGPCKSIIKFWHPGTATWDEVLTAWDGHSLVGVNHLINEGGYDHATGHYLAYRPLNNAAALHWAWTTHPCTDTTLGPPWPHPPCAPPFDQHDSWIYNKGNDEEPVIGAQYTYGTYPNWSPWQNEIVGISMCGLPGEPECPPRYPSNRQWRFGRTFNFGTNKANFNNYASIGTLSQTGKYYALTSTGLGGFGSTSGHETCRAGFRWTKSYNYTNGKMITPYWTTNAGGYTFQASCSGSCMSGAKEPTWPQDGTGSVVDNQVTWNSIGVTNCRSDVLIYRLQ
jgi:hypothetical protein